MIMNVISTLMEFVGTKENVMIPRVTKEGFEDDR
jgi:hypothetical protein